MRAVCDGSGCLKMGSTKIFINSKIGLILSKIQDAFFIGVITLMIVGTVAINKAQAANINNTEVKTQAHQAIMAKAYQVRGKTYHPMKSVAYFTQTGQASWYGPGFHGKKTSNGEIFNMNGLSAAHRTLPLGTQVRVTNTTNGKSVVVRVNDRGPFHGNRVIDLSKGAAAQLGFVNNGMASVKIETLHGKPVLTAPAQAVAVATSPKTPTIAFAPNVLPTMYWHVQNFNNEHDARAFMLQTSQQLQAAQSHYPVDMVKQETGYVVRVGPFATQQHIDDVKSKLPNLALHHL